MPERQTEDSSDDGKCQAFGHQLPNYLPSAAPSAVRMAMSRCRTEPRISIRFATLAQAISRTNVAPTNTNSDARTCPTNAS